MIQIVWIVSCLSMSRHILSVIQKSNPVLAFFPSICDLVNLINMLEYGSPLCIRRSI